MSKTRTCASCAHFRPSEQNNGGQAGQCRRFPPVPMLLQQQPTVLGAGTVGMAGVSPPVHPGFSCGEFRDVELLSVIKANAGRDTKRHTELLTGDTK